jgi:hypothetical protein
VNWKPRYSSPGIKASLNKNELDTAKKYITGIERMLKTLIISLKNNT